MSEETKPKESTEGIGVTLPSGSQVQVCKNGDVVQFRFYNAQDQRETYFSLSAEAAFQLQRLLIQVFPYHGMVAE